MVATAREVHGLVVEVRAPTFPCSITSWSDGDGYRPAEIFKRSKPRSIDGPSGWSEGDSQTDRYSQSRTSQDMRGGLRLIVWNVARRAHSGHARRETKSICPDTAFDLADS